VCRDRGALRRQARALTSDLNPVNGYVVPDTPLVLDFWKQQAASCAQRNVYFVFPQARVELGSSVRELIAVQRVLAKKDRGDHAYKVLEGRLTKLRQDLQREFAKTYGNTGLASGTVVIQAGPDRREVPVESWNELLPSICAALENEFPQQIRVRCGTFNAWQERSAWAPIEHIVERILGYDDTPAWHDEFLGFAERSQEGAIIDGVLIENALFRYNALAEKWEFKPVKELEEVYHEISHYLQSGGSGDREFGKLFARLVDPPYGIPNGVIPLLIAVVIRTDSARIGIYQRGTGGQIQRKSNLAEAVVEMVQQPDRFATRYNKLTGKQRMVFKAIGPEMNQPFTDRDDRGEAFYDYCNHVRDQLREWANTLPDEVVVNSSLSEPIRRLLKTLRGGVPPQISLLSDALLAVIGEDSATHQELQAADSETRQFPQTVQTWRTVREQVDRYIDGVKAGLARQISEVVGPSVVGQPNLATRLAESLRPLAEAASAQNPLATVFEKISKAQGQPDVVSAVASAITGKDTSKLTSEDFGVATGVLRAAEVVAQVNRQCAVVLPSGERRKLMEVSQSEAENEIRAVVSRWRDAFGLTTDQVMFLILQAAYTETPATSTEPGTSNTQSLEAATIATPGVISPIVIAQTEREAEAAGAAASDTQTNGEV